MFEESGMSNQPPEWSEEPGDDGLERMFAAEESAIRDNGFTARVVEKAHSGVGFRRTIIYGAGMAGFGAALAGIMEMAPHLPKLTGWWPGVSSALQNSAAPDVSSPTFMIVAALAVGAGFLALAVASQER
jgi:hypothetical protein